jgi:hypothetical protein
MLDKSEQRVVDDIAAFGWHLIGVLPDQHGPGFMCSIGMMQPLNHPEIIIFGLNHQLMKQIINNMGKEIQEGRCFTEPILYDGLVAHFACKMHVVSKQSHERYLGYAMWHRRHVGNAGSLEVVQCLWPDNAGLFPDEPGFNPDIAGLQPLL